MHLSLVVIAIVILVPGAGAALHLGLLAAASLFYRPPRASVPAGTASFLVLIPAHNEEKVLGSALEAVFADARQHDRVVVVADRCSDRTAEIARAAGALVLERDSSQEPGRAAARQSGVEFALGLPWDAIVMIDADSVIQPGFFAVCEVALSSGAEALQARSEAEVGRRFIDHAALAASSMQGLLMPRGRDRLGVLVRLRGTGMVLARRLVSEFVFRAPASEDLWYSLDLCLAGILPRHVEAARLRSRNVKDWGDAADQRVRYEAGRMSAAREFVGPLFRRHSAASLEAAWFLLTPPFALAALLILVAGAVALAAGADVLAAVAAALFVLLAMALVVGLIEARAGLRTWLGLAIAPWYLPWKALIQIRALLQLQRPEGAYGATPR